MEIEERLQCEVRERQLYVHCFRKILYFATHTRLLAGFIQPAFTTLQLNDFVVKIAYDRCLMLLTHVGSHSYFAVIQLGVAMLMCTLCR
jgi:hypothetical protein